MRRRAKRDGNHGEIVRVFEAAGCSVLDLAAVGSGCPDLLVNCRGVLRLVEIKNPSGRNKVEAGQAEFHSRWPVAVVRTVDEAIEVARVR